MALSSVEIVDLLRDMEQTAIASAKEFPTEHNVVETWDGLVFHLGGSTVVAPLDDVSEILDSVPAMTSVPGAKPWISGVANVRGGLLPVIDMESFFFGTATRLERRVRVLIVRDDDVQTGLMVRDVEGMRHFEIALREDSDQKIHDRLQPYINGLYRYDDNNCYILSLRALTEAVEFQLAAI